MDSLCIGLITGKSDVFAMNLRRKFLRALDLRVQQHMTGKKSVSMYQLGRLSTLESILFDPSDSRTDSHSEKPLESSSL